MASPSPAPRARVKFWTRGSRRTNSIDSLNDPSFPEVLDLHRGVAEPREHFVVMRPKLGGDADPGRGFREMPRRPVDLQPLAIFRVVDLVHIAIGQHVGVV